MFFFHMGRYILGKNPQLKPSISTTQVEQVNTIKLLGVTIDNSLSWSQINNIVIKNGKRNRYQLEVLCFYHTIYNEICYPFFDSISFRILPCSSATKYDLKKLQIAQNRAAHCSYWTSISYMHKHLAWLRTLAVSLLLMWKIIYTGNKPVECEPENCWCRLEASSCISVFHLRLKHWYVVLSL